MAEQRIHTMWRMIAIRDGGLVLAVFKNQFSVLVEKLLPDLDTFERISFKMAASPISAAGSREHAKKMPEWEQTFILRLKQRMVEVGHLLTFDVTGEELAEYLPDLLEGYRGNHLDTFAFSVDELHSSGARVLTMDVFETPNLWQRLTKAVREPAQRFVIPVPNIQRIAGTSVQMEMHTRTETLWLGRNGFIASGGANAG